MDFRQFAVKRDTAGSLEIGRIVSIPIEEMLTDDEMEEFSRLEIQASYFDDGFRLLSTQCGAVIAYDNVGGLFANIGVGWGKTLITLMIADRAMSNYGIDKTILLVPSQVYPQLTKIDIPWARKRVGLRVPFHLLGRRNQESRRALVKSGKRGCYIMPYSLLSTEDTDFMLNAISPGCIILDEAHNVKNPRAARTRRLMRYLTEKAPQLCALSGTITKKSIRDYGHLISHALKGNSPLPLEPVMIDEWAAALDADADPGDAQTGQIKPLLYWFQEHFPEEDIRSHVAGYRQAYNRRLNTCPGVVMTGDNEIGVSLAIENLPVKDTGEGFDRLEELIDQVEELWRTPSGDEIEFGFHKWRYLFELSAGFYHHLCWPTVEQLAKRPTYRNYTDEEIEGVLQLAQEHHAALQNYHRVLRQFIKHCAKPGLDTPMQIGLEMKRNGAKNVWGELYEAWMEARDLAFDDMPERMSIPTPVCDYKIRHAVKWAKNHKRGLVWFHHKAMGRWAAEAMQEAGIENAVWCPSESDRTGMDTFVVDPKNKDKILVCSMNGHGTGKNMQHFKDQLFMQFPRDSSLVEQVIGRTHRTGQTADELTVHTNNTIDFDHYNMAACLVDTIYQQQTMDDRKKLLYASWSPLPRVYPDEFLRERGFRDVHQLSKEAKQALVEKFGRWA